MSVSVDFRLKLLVVFRKQTLLSRREKKMNFVPWKLLLQKEEEKEEMLLVK